MAAAGAGRSATISVRAITRGPSYHWFGYYDKLQFDPESRYALGIANRFQHRLPTADDTIDIGMVDTRDGDKWIALGSSRSWSWHQGPMLQWLPGSRDEVIWNDRDGDRFIARIVNVRTKRERRVARAIYCLTPDARYGLVNDFARSFSMRPETGYAGGRDAHAEELAPKQSGIWRVDLRSGASELIVSLADVLEIPLAEGDWTGCKHYFDHLLVAPGGKRFAFFQRWGKGPGLGFSTRMFTADVKGGGLRMIDPSGKSSHYNWRDPEHVVLWTHHPSNGERFYLIHEPTAKYEALAPDVLNKNGHISYLPNRRWIVSDTSPDGERKQHVFLFDTAAGRTVEIGAYYAAPEFKGVWRCDTTPRTSPDGRKIVFDSPHEGNGRQMYLADISAVTG
jgi:hypothetical protein